jgi:multiple sugar transport system ATP-binding protein
MLAGLEPVDSGQITIGGRDVTHAEPKDRDIAMVFQNYALYPHMTVSENMGFALKLAGTDKAEIRRRVEQAADMLDLRAYLGRKPKALSGGQRQRVAMGRAIVRQPQVFLMDEPLSNLDAKLRVETRAQIAQLQRRLGTTTMYVTHDQTEAMTMGDRVAVLKDGVLQQCASPRQLYRAPANVFVAGFMGSPSMNLFTVPVTDGGVRIGDQLVPVPRDVLTTAGSEVILGVRPEHVEISESGGLALEIDVVEELGSEAFVFGRSIINGQAESLVARVDWRDPPERGQVVHVRIDDAHAHVFGADEAGERLAA